ncbi:hypothetical protein HY449_03660 [Candidatus Pacearchaeota archaeon]|nr:hypothetical protein [Candidatus Pacearchaeota archaeon]
MGNINISLKKEAYEFLRILKGGDKSFSDIILEFKGSGVHMKRSGKSLAEFAKRAGKLGVDWEEKERGIVGFRREFEERMDKTSRDMEKSRKKSNRVK